MKSIFKGVTLSLVASIVTATAFSCSSDNQLVLPEDKVLAQSNDQGFLASRAFVQTGYTVVKVFYTNKKQLENLNELGMDIWMVQNGFVLGQVNDDVMSRLKKTTLKMEMVSPKEGFSVLNNFDPQYMTYDEMLTELRKTAEKYPTLAKLQDFGDTWEKTKGKADRDLWTMRITGKGDGASKPGIVFFGNHHARELVTVEIPMRLINHLLSNYGKDPDITAMVDNTEIFICPMVNPDGHTLAEKGQNWRKNKNDNKDVSATAGLGVDLNRNYGHQWNTGGSSTSTSSDTYHGKAPFSEPETQAVKGLLDSHKNLKIMMSYHSFSNLILWPWGWTEQDTPDAARFAAVGGKLGANTGYKPEQASDLYVASGITDDYAYGKLKMLSFTTEIGGWGDGFDPPYSKVDKFWKENLPNALYLIKLAGEQGANVGKNVNAGFGPDVSKVSKNSDGTVNVSLEQKYENPASKVEYFVGKIGLPGTGTPVAVTKGNSVSFDVSNKAGSTIYVRAQSPDGKWGPITAGSLK